MIPLHSAHPNHKDDPGPHSRLTPNPHPPRQILFNDGSDDGRIRYSYARPHPVRFIYRSYSRWQTYCAQAPAARMDTVQCTFVDVLRGWDSFMVGEQWKQRGKED